MTTFVASANPGFADVPVGETVTFGLTVGNVSDLIDGYNVRVFGLDSQWVTLPDGIRRS